MSKYVVCEVHCCDEHSIVEAIKEMGFAEGLIRTGQKISIPSDRAGGSYDAQIVIPAKVAGTTYPIGFVKQADGKYMLVMSSQDRFTKNGQRFLSSNMSGTGEFVQLYAKQRIIKAARANYGHRVSSCENVDGKIKVRVTIS